MHIRNVTHNALLLIFLLGPVQALAAHLVIDAGAGGGDCAAVGNWDGGTGICTLTTAVANSIEIVSPNTTLDCAGHALSGPAPADVLYGSGILLGPGSDGATVRNCDVADFIVGISAVSSDGHSIHDNAFHENDSRGIHIELSNGNLIRNNASHRNRFGILVFEGFDNAVLGNSADDNGIIGIYVIFGDGTTIEGNDASRNEVRGLSVVYSNHVTIRENEWSDNVYSGMYMQSGHHLVVEGNVATGNANGGMGVWQIDDSLFVNNEFTGNDGTSDALGFSLAASTRNVLRGNRMVGNGFNFVLDATDISHYDHDIDTSNTVNGKKIYFLKGLSDTILGPAQYHDAGAIYCVHCSHVTIRGMHFNSRSGEGIALAGTHDSVVTGNSVVDYRTGFKSLVSDRNLVTNNNFSVTSPFGFGLEMSGLWTGDRNGGDDNVVENNTVHSPLSVLSSIRVSGERYVIRNNRILSGSSLEVYTDDSLIEGNLLKHAGGIRVLESSNTVVRNNTISDGTPNLWTPEDPYPQPWDERGIQIFDTSNITVTGNRVTGMLDHGLQIVNSPGITVTLNDIHGNALNGVNFWGDVLYQVNSDAPVELSSGGVGNYWGRNCGQENQGEPPFQPGVDSNGADVIDSHPFGHSVASISGGNPPSPCQ